MSKSHADQRRHRRKVAGTPQGLREHQLRDFRRQRYPLIPVEREDLKPIGRRRRRD